LVRVGLGALAVTPFALLSLRGRWELVRRNAGLIALYGLLAVAGAQFCYFSAIKYMEVGPALLIEYTAPAAVVAWLWVRHGHRPGRLTLLGAAVAALGLVLVLDLVSGADLSFVGVLWAFGAMIGVTGYFVISADHSNDLPPLVLAGGGLVAGTVILGILAAIGVLPMAADTASAAYAHGSWPWWLPLVLLGVVTAAVSYSTGVLAGRRLGSRLASFVGLLEVLAAIGFAWLLLDELSRPAQLLGGLLIVLGVIAVRLGERSTSPHHDQDSKKIGDDHAISPSV
jgi:drug/metabolite transporter (DMT)-like permease